MLFEKDNNFQIEGHSKLDHKFYKSDVLTIALQLLGKIFIKKENDKFLAAKIVEVEAYHQSDPAAHSFGGKSNRNSVMFEDGGLLYVYFTYGMHFCCNVVTGVKNEGSAVLIRAVEPLNFLNILIDRRFPGKEVKTVNLTNGPAKFAQAFGIDKKFNGISLLEDKIFILDNDEIDQKEIIQTTRIGITKAVDYPWRFYIKNNPFVSRK